MSFISDLRAYSKGELTEEELKARIHNSDQLNEAGIGIPTSNDHLLKIQRKPKPAELNDQSLLLRTMKEAAYGGTAPSHWNSVKITGKNGNYNIIIPETAGDEFGRLDIFMKSKEGSAFKKVTRSILYDNQELFIAYWVEDKTERPNVVKALENILIDRMVDRNYAKHPVTAQKTQKQLDSDMEALEKDVQTRLQDDTIRLAYYLRSR